MNLPTLSSSPIAVPAVSCFFETLHEPTCVEQMEPVLDQLTMDQIVQVEQMIRKIKKRKARALADDGVNKKHKVEQGIKSSPPVVELRDGIEWVSFVYSHNRVLQRHAIRTDIDTLTVDDIDTSFQLDNCVYPRANVPQEKYQGNRWDYETQCNVLGWKLAWMNPDLVGKRGLIQRAVDSYRNRTPTMRSRRAARQTKMLNGTLRKRTCSSVNNHCLPCIPKTITMEDEHHVRFRIKIHLDTIDLDTIDTCFRLANCVYPRAMVSPDMSSQKWMEENLCNELGWKMKSITTCIGSLSIEIHAWL
ncbi:hypothetical protein BC941DRAFT_28737 [Chlamydoabsidia padenii]|nr:hypothetical protein BC941DRAFT_28737 [Chlamydoabsidia padenii]